MAVSLWASGDIASRSGDDVLSGRFTKDGGSFMAARHEAEPVRPVRADLGERSEGVSGIPMEDFDDPHLAFLLSARLPGLSLQYGMEEGRPMRRLVLPDGRWGEVTYHREEGGRGSYQDHGQGFWETVEQTWSWWVAHGKPAWDRFGLTVAPDCEHTLWYESPDGDSWRVPTRP
ncbi:hypothetical protein [Streptomyces sp. NPDC057552]|uniref:hypothetical protein n=1 Tax=Streptomyces sp. NPDC057552 TaxID=3350537 RepID=UPI0036C7AE97